MNTFIIKKYWFFFTVKWASARIAQEMEIMWFIMGHSYLITLNGLRAIRDNDEEVDGRELHKYSWRQMLDEAKYLLDKCLDSSSELLIQSVTYDSSSNTNVSMKRK